MSRRIHKAKRVDQKKLYLIGKGDVKRLFKEGGLERFPDTAECHCWIPLPKNYYSMRDNHYFGLQKVQKELSSGATTEENVAKIIFRKGSLSKKRIGSTVEGKSSFYKRSQIHLESKTVAWSGDVCSGLNSSRSDIQSLALSEPPAKPFQRVFGKMLSEIQFLEDNFESGDTGVDEGISTKLHSLQITKRINLLPPSPLLTDTVLSHRVLD